MKVITGKIKKGLSIPIRKSQKTYAFMYPPVAAILIGDHVLVDVSVNGRPHFQVVKVENIMELSDYKSEDGLEPTCYVICKLPVKDFEKRCRMIRQLKKTTRNRNMRKQNKMKKIKKYTTFK